MAKYIYALSEKGMKSAAGFTHAGKEYKVDYAKRGEFRMELDEPHPAPDFMGLKLIDKKP